jgi:hypothetical protein
MIAVNSSAYGGKFHRGTSKGGAAGPKPPKPKFKKQRFCRYYDITGFT